MLNLKIIIMIKIKSRKTKYGKKAKVGKTYEFQKTKLFLSLLFFFYGIYIFLVSILITIIN
tara:strand:- start:1846 stop:2028 length:183 start_codon:yes stop_codon:yes gene_type:complete